jgi:hypothetical protein
MNQAMIIRVFSGRAGFWFKDGRTATKVPIYLWQIYDNQVLR